MSVVNLGSTFDAGETPSAPGKLGCMKRYKEKITKNGTEMAKNTQNISFPGVNGSAIDSIVALRETGTNSAPMELSRRTPRACWFEARDSRSEQTCMYDEAMSS
jgi:hypothetical protein